VTPRKLGDQSRATLDAEETETELIQFSKADDENFLFHLHKKPTLLHLSTQKGDIWPP